MLFCWVSLYFVEMKVGEILNNVGVISPIIEKQLDSSTAPNVGAFS